MSVLSRASADTIKTHRDKQRAIVWKYARRWRDEQVKLQTKMCVKCGKKRLVCEFYYQGGHVRENTCRVCR